MNDTWNDRNTDCARLYRTLALAFDRPGEGAAETIRNGEFADGLREAAARVDGSLEEAAENVEETVPSEPDELRSTHAATFGPDAESSVARHEVAYAPGSLVTNTDRLADIAGFYQAFGLEISEDARDRTDYFPTQLEFLQHLALQQTYLEGTDDEKGITVVSGARKLFLEDHVGRWVPRFVDALEEESDSEFYLALGTLLEEFVASEIRRFDLDPDEFERQPTAPLEGMAGLQRDEAGRLSIDCGATGTDQPTDRSEP